MKKLLLVVLIGMVLAIDVYGFVTEYVNSKVNNIDHIKETTITVYTE